MANFTYRGYNAEGNRAVGCYRAGSAAAAKTALEASGINSVEAQLSQTRHSTSNYALVGPRELSLFARQMSIMFSSQVTLMEGVQLLADQTDNKQLKICLKEVYGHMDKGYTLAESMGMYPNIFGTYLLSMVTIGETSGTLDSIFAHMSDYFDKEAKTRKKIRAAVTYPAILTVLMAAIVILLIVEVLPMFKGILDNMAGELSGGTTAILNVGTAISNYIGIIVGAIVVIALVLYILGRTGVGKHMFDRVKITIPISRYLSIRVLTARFSRSLSILIKSGVQLLNALEETRRIVDNRYIAAKFDKAVAMVREGGDLGGALKSVGVFPPLFLKMVHIGQGAGQLDVMLDKSATVFDEDVDDAIERITLLLEPILIIVLSLIVGVILVSVMVPMIDIMKSIG